MVNIVAFIQQFIFSSSFCRFWSYWSYALLPKLQSLDYHITVVQQVLLTTLLYYSRYFYLTVLHEYSVI